MKKKFKILILILSLIVIVFTSSSKVNASSTAIKAGIVNADGYSLNVRQNPSTSSSIITKLSDNSYISLISKNGSWWYIEYGNNKYGYVSSDYISIIASSYNQIVKTGGGTLNVRSSSSIYSSKIDSLYEGENVIVIGQNNGFSKIIYRGNKIGYVSSLYLGALQTYKYNPIYLNVQSYKQFDSRWASVTIGNYGETLKEIGCTTTCLSMTESYRTNTTITPLNMRYRLSYTSGGSLYWPSNYINDYSTDYLTKLYSLLQSGKPAIISFKKTNGSLHFVVVTGYTGTGNTLNAQNFIINDPGSSTRTRLNELFATYPYYNKINYYTN